MKDTSSRLEIEHPKLSRRRLLGTLAAGAGAVSLATVLPDPAGEVIAAEQRSHASLKITDYELFHVRAPSGRKWIFIRLKTNLGLTGLGEIPGRDDSVEEIREFFSIIRDKSPFAVEAFRNRGMERARTGGPTVARAFCSLEIAMWDLIGKALGVPIYNLFGGKFRDSIPVYANINRATSERTPEGFAKNARTAVSTGDTAIKAAPFDGFPDLTAPRAEIKKAADLGVACIAAIREAVGPQVKILIDCHSHFDVDLAINIARRLEPYNLFWIEEPVNPLKLEETVAIQSAIKQDLAGGEHLFGLDGFATLCKNEAVKYIMPDLAWCGGIKEGMKIATMAELFGNILVAPHNAIGPISTAAAAQVCAAIPNFKIMERQWTPHTWRGDLVDPPERFVNGALPVPDGPGIGVQLNETVVRKHLE